VRVRRLADLRRLPRAAVAGTLAAGLALGAAACGTGGLVTGGDADRGKQLFQEKCGSCHALADAGTAGTIGPNLDNAFASARRQGFDESSFRQLVAGQIKYPVTNPSTGEPGMPADLVTGDDVDAVAMYVASVAGKPGAGEGGGGITATDGKGVFAQAGCGSCHTFADAGTSGTIGPDLDQSKPDEALVVDRVTEGRGAMPSFADRLSEEQINAVAEYVSSAAGE
jgi:cbb3-type cytochrome c oxidase subunit III